MIGADIKDHEVTIFDFSGATYVDDSAAMVIEQLIEVAGRQETEVIVMGATDRVADILHTLDVLRHVPDGHESRDPGRGAGGRPEPAPRLISGRGYPLRAPAVGPRKARPIPRAARSGTSRRELVSMT